MTRWSRVKMERLHNTACSHTHTSHVCLCQSHLGPIVSVGSAHSGRLALQPGEAEDLATALAGHQLGHGAEVAGEALDHHPEQALLGIAPHVLLNKEKLRKLRNIELGETNFFNPSQVFGKTPNSANCQG